MFYFYMVRCSDNTLYSGKTNNLKRRINEHNSVDSKSARYTKTRRPVVLVYSEKFKTIKEALRREHEVKQWSKPRKEKLLKFKI